MRLPTSSCLIMLRGSRKTQASGTAKTYGIARGTRQPHKPAAASGERRMKAVPRTIPVLILEDNPADSLLIQESLKLYSDCEFYVFSNGDDAFQFLDRE